MRVLVLLIPIALVSGYAVHQLRSSRNDAAPPAPPTVGADRAASRSTHDALIAVRAPHAAGAFARGGATSARRDGGSAEIHIRGAGHALVTASLDGVLELIRQGRENPTIDSVAAVLQLISALDATMETTADVAAMTSALEAALAVGIDGSVEIQTGSRGGVTLRSAPIPAP